LDVRIADVIAAAQSGNASARSCLKLLNQDRFRKERRIAVKGLEGMLAFLGFLRSKKIMFGIEQQRDDALMVSFALVSIRIEVEFFVDHIEYSVFEGDESVACDENDLMALIQRNTD
jgi:hypothetical protein